MSFSILSNSFPPLSIDQSINVYCTNNHLLAEGVPYNVRVFAENGVGNGTFCIITDFGNEGRKLLVAICSQIHLHDITSIFSLLFFSFSLSLSSSQLLGLLLLETSTSLVSAVERLLD